ncbi:MAG TPA: hypothetical protein VLC79_04185 [Cellvibrio sp.]|nr:hypothetical protein [Cellvibrio sp.]
MSNTARQNDFHCFFSRSLALCAVLLCSGAPVIAEENYTIAGSAYNLENNQLVYRELYTGLDENKSVRVDYAKPDGDVFASKTLVYQGEPFQPSFSFEDKRDNEYTSAQFQGARLVLTEGRNGNQNEKTILDNARLVIDAGFDAYIQLNWDKLTAGKRLKFDFALPDRLTTEQLEVRQIKGSESPVYEANYGREWIYFRITPAKKITSMFADPIYLAYDPNGKYLMRFYGRSNIDDDNGDPQDVRIEYEYAN